MTIPPQQPPGEPTPSNHDQRNADDAAGGTPDGGTPYGNNPYGTHAYGANPNTGGPLSTPSSAGDDRLWATLAHVGAIVAMIVALAFLAPLIVLLVKGEQSPFVRRHAVESLNFQITGLIAGAVAIVLGIVTLGLGFILILPVALAYAIFWLVCIIVASARANDGKEYRYPLTLRLVK